MKKTNYKLLLLIFAINLSNAIAQTTTSWKGTSSTNWSTSANWTNGIPSSTIDAVLGDANFTGSKQPTLTATSSAKSLTIGASVTTTLTISEDISISGNITINSNGKISHTDNTITLNGNFSNSGTYTASSSGSAITFAGSTQTIGGSVASTFRKLTINSGSTVSLNSNISISGTSSNLTVSGVLNPDTYTVSGTGTYTVNGTLKVYASTYAGNYSISGTATINVGSIIEYAASSIDQTVSNSITYSTLTISGGRTKSLSGNLASLKSSTSAIGNIYVNSGTFDLSTYTASRGTSVAGGTLSVADGATLKIGGTNSIPSNYNTITLNSNSTVGYTGTTQAIYNTTYGNLTLSGSGNKTPSANLTIAKNFNLSAATFVAGSYTHSIGGDFTMSSGTFTNTGSTVILNGSAIQNLSSTGSFNKLKINNTSNINLAGSITVNDSLALVAGKIVLGNYNLTLGSNSKITGASSSNYIVAVDSGTLTQQITNGGSKAFPIGSSSDYLPATIALTSASTTDNFSLNLKSELRLKGTTGNLVTDKSVNATWHISEGTVGGSNATITLQFKGSLAHSGMSKTKCRLIHFSSNSWDYGSTDLAVTGTDPYSISRSGFTSFSPFAVSSAIPLPVTWVKVSGERIKDDNYIHWTTANELNNEYFAIESSADGKNFNEIGREAGASNSMTSHDYNFIHKEANEDMYFYRIKQVDYNGHSEYSKIIIVTPAQNQVINNVILYPKPVTDAAALSISLNENTISVITVSDVQGKLVYNKSSILTKGNNLLSVDMTNYPPGTYFLQITNDSGVLHSSKFIKN